MPLEIVRLNEQAKHQLARLTRYTGISHRNVLCRWALSLSLAELSAPPPIDVHGEDAIEIPWRILGGKHSELYLALLRVRMNQLTSGPAGNDDLQLQTSLQLHIHRGLGYLVGNQKLADLPSLLLSLLSHGHEEPVT